MGSEVTPGMLTTSRRYSPAEEHAVRSVRQLGTELCTGHGMVQRVAAKLGSGIESVWS